jgi:hypothetical protein
LVACAFSHLNNFNGALDAATFYGSATWTNQAAQLTDAVNGVNGSAVFSGITFGSYNSGFNARFNLTISATGPPADGVSFAVGSMPSTWGESGPGTAHSLAVGFDTYPNGGTGDIGIHVWVNGTHIAANATNPLPTAQACRLKLVTTRAAD